LLTADLVRAYRRKGDLKISGWKGDLRQRALTIAKGYLAIAEDSVGKSRGELKEAMSDVEVGARERRLADGLRKLVMDRCEFEVQTSVDPAELRAEVFQRAAALRSEAETIEGFSREAILEEASEKHGQPVEEIERLLYADLKKAHRLLRFEAVDAEALVTLYESSQVQAVLLKAEKVVVEVECASPAAYRQLFRKLKFHRLLHTITKSGGGYRIEVDGPFSMFSSVTKYGLQLAMLVPALRACDRWALEATVRWGKDRSRLRFTASGERDMESDDASLPPEVEKLLEKFRARRKQKKTLWKAAVSRALFDLPGVGVCVPDLVFTHEESGAKVYFEALGFWSRDAVWKRVELVEEGLPTPVVFAVPERLRVSEAVLPSELPGALYVYKGVIRPTRVEECLDQVASV